MATTLIIQIAETVGVGITIGMAISAFLWAQEQRRAHKLERIKRLLLDGVDIDETPRERVVRAMCGDEVRMLNKQLRRRKQLQPPWDGA